MSFNIKKKKQDKIENTNQETAVVADKKSKEDTISVGNFLKNVDSKVEEVAFDNISCKIKLISKILLYIFCFIGLIGIVLTALLTSSLGVFGVLLALFVVVVFVFLGYAISSLLYGYASVVENSHKNKTQSYVSVQPTKVQESVKEEVITDIEFPEF